MEWYWLVLIGYGIVSCYLIFYLRHDVEAFGVVEISMISVFWFFMLLFVLLVKIVEDRIPSRLWRRMANVLSSF